MCGGCAKTGSPGVGSQKGPSALQDPNQRTSLNDPSTKGQLNPEQLSQFLDERAKGQADQRAAGQADQRSRGQMAEDARMLNASLKANAVAATA